MSGADGGGTAPSVLEARDFPAALERVAALAAGPLGAARVRARRPGTDADVVRAALAQVAELQSLLITDDSIRAEPVPDIAPALELLAVPGSALDGPTLALVAAALVASRHTAAELGRLAKDAPRTAALRVDPPPKEVDARLAAAIAPDGEVLDGASRDLAKARKAVRETPQRLVAPLQTPPHRL